MTAMRDEVSKNLAESTTAATQYLGGLQTGIAGLNGVLEKLGEKQVVVQQVKKKGWFSKE
jgi:hypothetical protein